MFRRFLKFKNLLWNKNIHISNGRKGWEKIVREEDDKRILFFSFLVIFLILFLSPYFIELFYYLYKAFIRIQGIFVVLYGISRYHMVITLNEISILYGDDWRDLLSPFSRAHLFIQLPFILFTWYNVMWDRMEQEEDTGDDEQEVFSENPQLREMVELNRNAEIFEDWDEDKDYITVYNLELELEEEEIIWEVRERYNQVYYDLTSFFSFKFLYPLVRFVTVFFPSFIVEMLTSQKDPFYYLTIFFKNLLYIPVAIILVFQKIIKQIFLVITEVKFNKVLYKYLVIWGREIRDFPSLYIMCLILALQGGILISFSYYTIH